MGRVMEAFLDPWETPGCRVRIPPVRTLEPLVISPSLCRHPPPQPKVVLVSTSANELQGHRTGAWLEELAVPYYGT